jgi:general nucleoside transport system ATP-binding protein
MEGDRVIAVSTDSLLPAPSVTMRGVRKSFGGVIALDDADLTLHAGEVHALLGENGAGKTTLMGVLAGMLPASAGSVHVNGQLFAPRSPREAWAAGVGMVHQHFKLVERLSVLENLSLGVRQAAWGLRLPYPAIRARVDSLADELGLEVPLDVLVEELPVGAQQRVEILKLLIRDPDILVLDEPTAVLAPKEVERLHTLLAGLAGQGRTVVLIAHKLDEVLAVADHVTVLRGGRSVLTAARSELDERSLIRAMVGTDVLPARRDSRVRPGEEVATLDAVHVTGPRGEEALRGVDLTVRRGEIVAIAGVDGNGQRELAAVLAGRRPVSAGKADLPSEIGFIPEDRGSEALVGEFTLVQNVALAGSGEDDFRRGPWIRWDRVHARTRDLIQRFDIRTSGADSRADELSGGNQQKVVVARELERARDLLVAQNPVRGLDVAAERFVHTQLLRLRAQGRHGVQPPGIVLISTDLDEVIALADRVLVMVRGELVDLGTTLDREEIGTVMVRGARPGVKAPESGA